MSSTTSISGNGTSQWQLLKELRASQTAASAAGSSPDPVSASAESATSASPVTSGAASAASGTAPSMLSSASSRLVADLQSFLLNMQSGATQSGATGSGASAGPTGSDATGFGLTSAATAGTAAASTGSGSADGISSGLQSVFDIMQNKSGTSAPAPHHSGHMHRSGAGEQDPVSATTTQSLNASGLAQQLMSSIQAYAKQAGSLAAASAAPALSA